MKTSLHLKDFQTIEDAANLLKQLEADGLPVINMQDELIGVITKEIVSRGHHPSHSISEVELNQDYAVVPEKDDIEKLYEQKKSFYILLNKYETIVGIISQHNLVDAYIRMIQLRLKELEAVFEHAHNGIVAIDQNGIITSFNPASEKLSGVKKERALGSFLTDVVVPGGMLEVLRTGKAQHAKKYQVGNRKYVTNRTPIKDGDEIIGVVGVFQDISEMEHISKELDSVNRLNQQLETIISASYDGIIITDGKGRIIRYNQAFCILIGIADKQDLNDKSIYKYLPTVRREVVKEVIKKKQSITLLENRKFYDNSLMMTINPVYGQDEKVSLLLINVRNITELIELKEEVEKNKRLSDQYLEELSQYRMEMKSRSRFIAESPKIKQVVNLVRKISNFESTVMILGESGTGKEEVARLVHLNSSRSQAPFITVNCGAIPEHLLESELFGYEGGAFTGANNKGKPGLFELADKGILFLDEIGDLPLSLQVKLLRVIQEKEVTRIGGISPLKVDVRILAATHNQLEEKVQRGEFREDLFFRLHVIPIVLPPLRERTEDLIPLIELFLSEFNQLYQMSKKLTSDSYATLLKYDWPGNVRELRNVIERCFVLSESDAISLKDLDYPVFMSRKEAKKSAGFHEEIRPLKEAVTEFEQNLIQKAIEKYGNTYKAAEVLSVDQSTIVRKLQKVKVEYIESDCNKRLVKRSLKK